MYATRIRMISYEGSLYGTGGLGTTERRSGAGKITRTVPRSERCQQHVVGVDKVDEWSLCRRVIADWRAGREEWTGGFGGLGVESEDSRLDQASPGKVEKRGGSDKRQLTIKLANRLHREPSNRPLLTFCARIAI